MGWTQTHAQQLLEDAREVLGSWSHEFFELRRRVEALAETAEKGTAGEQPGDESASEEAALG